MTHRRFLTMLTQTNKSRQQSGQAITALIAFVGVGLVLVAGLFAFEIARFNLALDQLSNCIDAAALAGEATLVTCSPTNTANTFSLSDNGYDNTNDALKAQASAATAAYKIFCKNSVLGNSLSNTVMPAGMPNSSAEAPPAPNPLPKPAPNQANLYIEFLTPTAGANTGGGQANQKIIKVSATFGEVPAFGNFVGLSMIAATDSVTAGIPMMDFINIVDVSGACDDMTNVTFIKRTWVNMPKLTSSQPQAMAILPHVDYVPVTNSAGLPAEGTISQVLGYPAYGSNVNALPPQGLENASSAPTPVRFSESVSNSRLLRGVTNMGTPPGNAPLQAAPPPSDTGPDLFTDMVVNLDGNKHFNGCTTSNGYAFPNIAVVVEAARGNLENPAVFATAGLVGNPYFMGIIPRPGYKALGYEYNAALLAKPFNAARSDSLDLSYAMLHTNNCNIGGINYNDHVGTMDLSIFTAPNVSSLYPQGDFPIPGAFILPNQYEQPLSDVLFLIGKELLTSPQARVWGQTSNTAAALSRSSGGQRSAIDWLNDPAYHRRNADRSIALFTNTAPAPSEMAAARNAAKRAHDLGIPLYIIGLAENPNTQAVQYAAYTDTNSDSGSGGLCGIAGHGSRFIQITDESDMPQAFGNVMRQMVKLAHTR